MTTTQIRAADVTEAQAQVVRLGCQDADELPRVLRKKQGVFEIANPIYCEVIPRPDLRQSQIRVHPASFVRGWLARHAHLMREWQSFWRKDGHLAAEGFQYRESGPHLVLMAFLQRVVNGDGRIEREYGLGRGAVDLFIEWKGARHAIEIKLRRDAETESEGAEQLARYLDTLGEAEGWLPRLMAVAVCCGSGDRGKKCDAVSDFEEACGSYGFMSQTITPLELFLNTLVAMGIDEIVGDPADLREAVHELEAEMLLVATEAYVAQRRGKRLSEAVVDFEDYPKLARFHTSVDDALFMTLPPEFARWAQRFLEKPPPPVLEALGTQLVTLAATESHPVRRVMFRVLLFEWIRLALTVLYHLGGTAADAGILSEDLSAIAEDSIDRWLADPLPLEHDERPVQILFVAAVAGTEQYAAELATVIGSLQSDYIDQLRSRARIEKALADFDRRDALLIRNAMAPAVSDEMGPDSHERPLSIEHLQARHPLALGGTKRNTLDQRLRRFRRALKAGDLAGLRRRDKALIDIVAAQAENKGENQ